MVRLPSLPAGLGEAVPRNPWAVTIKASKSHGQTWFKLPCGALMTTGILQNSAAGRQQFERQMEARRLAEARQEEFKPLRQGWCLGGEEFRQAMLEFMDGRLGKNHAGQLQRETAEPRASRIIAEELAGRDWTEADLARCLRSDPGKLAIAARLRSETTLPVKAIAARVQIGTTKGAKSLLHHLAPGRAQHKSARMNKADAQLEFQSTV